MEKLFWIFKKHKCKNRYKNKPCNFFNAIYEPESNVIPPQNPCKIYKENATYKICQNSEKYQNYLKEKENYDYDNKNYTLTSFAMPDLDDYLILKTINNELCKLN